MVWEVRLFSLHILIRVWSYMQSALKINAIRMVPSAAAIKHRSPSISLNDTSAFSFDSAGSSSSLPQESQEKCKSAKLEQVERLSAAEVHTRLSHIVEKITLGLYSIFLYWSLWLLLCGFMFRFCFYSCDFAPSKGKQYSPSALFGGVSCSNSCRPCTEVFCSTDKGQVWFIWHRWDFGFLEALLLQSVRLLEAFWILSLNRLLLFQRQIFNLRNSRPA